MQQIKLPPAKGPAAHQGTSARDQGTAGRAAAGATWEKTARTRRKATRMGQLIGTEWEAALSLVMNEMEGPM